MVTGLGLGEVYQCATNVLLAMLSDAYRQTTGSDT